jgi:transcriptional regulator with XRE-family HTH domain
MSRTLQDVIETLPKDRQEKINARYRQLKGEVESLAALRKAAGKAQTDIAAAMKVSQPSISKIEKQSDMYLSTLRGYVKALGGDIELVVRLPSGTAVELQGLGDLAPAKKSTKGQARGKKSLQAA